MARLTVVVVTWNSARFLPRCLAGVAQQTISDLQLVVVDNASDDASRTIVRQSRPDAVVIENGCNAGFSRAVNQAVAQATGEFVLLVNPDAYLEPDYAERLIAALEAAGDRFGAATGKLLRGEGDDIRPTNVIDSKGIRMTRNGRHLDIGQGEVDDERSVHSAQRSAEATRRSNLSTEHCALSTEVFGISGAAALYRMSFIRDVSINGEFLDEDFFAFREDADVAWRGRIFGWHALYVPDAVAFHVRTVTPQKRRELSPDINMHSVKNRFLLRIRNESLWLALRNAPFEIPRDLITIAAVLTIERTSLPALTWLWRNRRSVFEKRRAIQSRRRIHDRELARWFR